MIAAVASFAVMVGVMNLAGYVAVGHGHAHGDVFTVISAHIVGMYGLVLVAGDLDRQDRPRRARWRSASCSWRCRTRGWSGSTGIAGMSLSLFGLGLGWNFAYVAATTELVSRAAPSERGRLVGFSDLALELHRRGARARRRRRLQRGRHGAARGRRRGARGRACVWIVLLPSAVGGRLVRRFSV